jgi:hypothetical protein
LKSELPDFDKLAALLRLLAPVDLATRPIYVVDGRGVPELRGADLHCGGFWSRFLDLQLRRFLIEAGRWNGRGHAVAILGGAHVGTAIHELAHALTFPRDDSFWALDPNQLANDLVKTALTEPPTAAEVSIPQPQAGDSSGKPPWHGHEFPWIRVCIHLERRANDLGLFLHPDVVHVAGAGYSLLPKSLYWRAIVDEAEGWRDSGRPLCDLIHEPVPPRLAMLWHFDTRDGRSPAPTRDP